MYVTLQTGNTATLICFPPAGASATFWKPLGQHLADWTIIAAEYPGHGRLIAQTCIEQRSTLLNYLAPALTPTLEQHPQPTIFIGHSLGAQIAFELALNHTPDSIILSGRNHSADHSAPPSPNPNTATDKELITWLKHLGGLPEHAQHHPELTALIARTLRADLKLSATDSLPGTLQCPLAIISGNNDPAATLDAMRGWHQRATHNAGQLELNGNHDAIRHHSHQVATFLKQIALAHKTLAPQASKETQP